MSVELADKFYTDKGVAISGATVQAILTDGTTSSTAASTTTDVNGRWAFESGTALANPSATQWYDVKITYGTQIRYRYGAIKAHIRSLTIKDLAVTGSLTLTGTSSGLVDTTSIQTVAGAKTFTSAVAITQAAAGTALAMENDDAGAAGVVLESYHNSASPLAGDVIFNAPFYGKDSTAAKTLYAAITATLDQSTNLSEYGSIHLFAMNNGTLTQIATIAGDGIHIDAGALRLRSGAGISSVTAGEMVYDTTATAVRVGNGAAAKTLADLNTAQTMSNKDLTLLAGAGAAPTGAGQIQYDTTLKHIVIGDGTKTKYVVSGPGNVMKGSDTSRTSTVAVADDPDLVVSLKAGNFYHYEALLLIDGATTGDFRVTMTLSGGGVGLHRWVGLGQTSAATVSAGSLDQSSNGDAVEKVFGTIGAGSNLGVLVRGTIYNLFTDQTLKVRWAQGTSDVTATKLLQGSWLRAFEN